jgi:hypothetical protein
MKYLIYLFIAILISSCSMSKKYANFRVGGKSKQEEKTIANENVVKQDSSIAILASDVSPQKEFVIHDTLMVKKLPGNKTMVVLKEKTENSNSILSKNKTNRIKQVRQKERFSLNKKNASLKNNSPLKGKNLNREIWTTIIIVSIVIGVIAFIISDSLFTAILISVLAAIGISLLIALAICIAVFLVFCVLLELIESL